MNKINKFIVNQDAQKSNNNNNNSNKPPGLDESIGYVLYLNDKTISQFEAMEKFIWNYQDDLMIQDAFKSRNNNINRSVSNELILKIIV